MWRGRRGWVILPHFPGEGEAEMGQLGSEHSTPPPSPAPLPPLSLRNLEPQVEVCKTSPGVIAGYMEQSEELKSYFHCTIKTCKGSKETALGPGGEHLACGTLAPPCVFLGGREGAGHAVILETGQ